jgi:hypothetical protein
VESARKRNKTNDFRRKRARFREKTDVFRVFFSPAPQDNQKLYISRRRLAAGARSLEKIFYKQYLMDDFPLPSAPECFT